ATQATQKTPRAAERAHQNAVAEAHVRVRSSDASLIRHSQAAGFQACRARGSSFAAGRPTVHPPTVRQTVSQAADALRTRLSLATDLYSRISPGCQASTAQMRSSVSKRTPLTLPDLSRETFCSVMPMRSASSFERILRRASMTSRLTTMGISASSYEARVF